MQQKFMLLKQLRALVSCLEELRSNSRTRADQADHHIWKWEKALYAMIDTLLDEAVKMEW